MGLSASSFYICGFPGTLWNRVGCSQCIILFRHYWPCVCKVQCTVSLMTVPKSECWSGWPQSASLSSHWGLIKVHSTGGFLLYSSQSASPSLVLARVLVSECCVADARTQTSVMVTIFRAHRPARSPTSSQHHTFYIPCSVWSDVLLWIKLGWLPHGAHCPWGSCGST